MDTTQTITHVSLCAGYGGIDLGLKRAIPSLRTIAFSEIEAFACANLVAKMEAGLLDPAPVWTDLKSFPWADFHGVVDILSGGYPCQPFSAAGKRLGAEDPRHLWPHISAGIAAMRPSLCFFENVEGHITLGLSDVIEDLAGLGYRTTWILSSAAEVGAPHQRKRIFILAHSQRERLERFYNRDTSAEPSQDVGTNPRPSGQCGAWPSLPGCEQYAWEPPRVVVADTGHANRTARGEGSINQSVASERQKPRGHCATMGDSTSARCARAEDPATDRSNESQGAWGQELERASSVGNADSEGLQERSRQQRSSIQGTHANGRADGNRQAQSPLGGDLDGSAGGVGYAELCVTCDNRTDELRLLGNGVVPRTAERAFRLMLGELMS